MAEFVSVCKNVIASNNKKGWVDPDPAIRVSGTKSGSAIKRAHELIIKDAHGNEVARIVSTQDGKPVIGCGAKVGIVTKYPTEIVE